VFDQRLPVRLIVLAVNGAIGQGYAEWACRQATSRYDQPTESITLYRMIQSSPVDGTYDEPTRQTLIEHDCEAE